MKCEVFEIAASIMTEPSPSMQVLKLLSEEPNINSFFYNFLDWVRVRKIFEVFISRCISLTLSATSIFILVISLCFEDCYHKCHTAYFSGSKRTFRFNKIYYALNAFSNL